MRPDAKAQEAADPERGVPARRLHVRHETRYDYAGVVEHAHHLVYLRPRETAWQRIDHWRLDIDPAPEGSTHGAAQGLAETRDIWGNWRHGFSHAAVHERLVVVSCFEATLASASSSQAPEFERSPAWDSVAHSLRYRAGELMPDAAEFVLASPLVPIGPALRGWAADLWPAGCPLLVAAAALMRRIHDQFGYEPDATDVRTDALAALAQRQGVCQDFAHVMIGTLRAMGLAARYVSGYVLTQPPAGQPRLIGADASHAWVAVWCPVQGWVAFDPTNAVLPGDDHVTLAWGRDYADVAPVHGVIRGGGAATLTVAVTVVPSEELRSG